jgi:hypothetical protein
MRSIRSGDLVRFIRDQSDEIEKVLFPGAEGEVYLVVSRPKMSVYTVPGDRSHETLSVEIVRGTQIQTVPVNVLERDCSPEK